MDTVCSTMLDYEILQKKVIDLYLDSSRGTKRVITFLSFEK